MRFRCQRGLSSALEEYSWKVPHPTVFIRGRMEEEEEEAEGRRDKSRGERKTKEQKEEKEDEVVMGKRRGGGW